MNRLLTFCLLFLLLASGRAEAVALRWDPVVSAGGSTLAGYRLYMGTTSGNYTTVTNVGNTTTYTIPTTSLVNGTTYYFCATALDTTGRETTCTKEVVWTYETNPVTTASRIISHAPTPNGSLSVRDLDAHGNLIQTLVINVGTSWTPMSSTLPLSDGSYRFLWSSNLGVGAVWGMNNTDGWYKLSNYLYPSNSVGWTWSPKYYDRASNAVAGHGYLLDTTTAGGLAVMQMDANDTPLKVFGSFGPFAYSANSVLQPITPVNLACDTSENCQLLYTYPSGAINIWGIPSAVWNSGISYNNANVGSAVSLNYALISAGWTPLNMSVTDNGSQTHVLYKNSSNGARILTFNAVGANAPGTVQYMTPANDVTYNFTTGFVPVRYDLTADGKANLWATDGAGNYEVLILNPSSGNAYVNMRSYTFTGENIIGAS